MIPTSAKYQALFPRYFLPGDLAQTSTLEWRSRKTGRGSFLGTLRDLPMGTTRPPSFSSPSMRSPFSTSIEWGRIAEQRMTSPVGRTSPACQTSMRRPSHEEGEKERDSLFAVEPAPDPEEVGGSVATSVASVFTERAVSLVTTVELEGEGEADMF